MTLPISVVVLAKNEASEIGEFLDALVGITDDIHLIDSGSTDGTVEVARKRGVHCYYNKFTGFGDQRNWAIDNVVHKYAWVLHLDADERPTTSLVEELRVLLARSPCEAGFFVPNKLMLGNCWLKFASGYPVYQVRLFHKERLRFQNFGHGQREVTNGLIGYLNSPYLHYAFSKGLRHWFEKHAAYAESEAQIATDSATSLKSELRSCFCLDRTLRRRALKQISFRLPLRGTLRLFEILFWRRGILDGAGGLTYARMMVAYESMIAAYLSAKRHGVR